MTQQQTAFIGLGVMGYPMAGHLQTAGYAVSVYNRTASRAREWLQQFATDASGRSGQTPRETVRESEVVFLCVGNDDDVRSVVYGEHGVLAGMQPGSILVDHTTASADLAKELFEACNRSGIGFLDTPVSGGQAGAEQGQLTVMVGGELETFERAEPVIQSYARAVRLLGPAGCGQLAKMVNQICIAGVLEGLAEAIHFAAAEQLDVEAVIDVISKGAAQSWQMENRAHTMIRDEFEFGFAVDWMRKDLGIALAAARKNGASLPLTALVDQMYAEIQAQGGGRWDTSSLIRRLAPLR